MTRAGVIVFGYGDFGIAAIEAASGAGGEVIAAVAPGNRAGSDVERFAGFAGARGIDVWTHRPKGGDLAGRLEAAAPDVILVWSYSLILPPRMLAVPARGAVNVHGALLPEYRGGHVLQWAIINGERETGATLHYMDAGIDTGPVIAESRFPIASLDDASSVRRKLRTAGAALIEQWWQPIANGTAPRQAQDESRARYWPLRTQEQGRIDFRKSSEDVCRLVRALTCNVPGAFVEIAGERLSVTAATPLPALAAGAAPGRIVERDSQGVRVATGDGDVMITAMARGGVPVVLDAVAAAGHASFESHP